MDPFLGEIRMFAGTFAPVGWNLCDGSILSIAENDALYNLLGTTYGGDGVSTFAVPDLRGRTPLHRGQGIGLSNREMGQMLGQEQVTLTQSQLPAHYHPIQASTVAGTIAIPTGNVWGASSTGEKQYTMNTAGTTLAAGSTLPAGGNQPHENMMPFQAVNFIIALQGIYPSEG